MLVFDKNIFGSNREIDSNGYLRVSDCSITKTQVSPYLAQEIPNWKDFGLERDKIYYVLRPEAELKKAVETFNNLPLTRKHIEVDVDNVPKEDIIGSLGDSAIFEDGYLKNNLIVYDQKYIDRIENGKQKELSCGYRYTPVRESGEYNGQHYDFVMKDIIGNHVALVKEGRAGHDVMVSDTIEAVKDKIMGLFGKKQIVGDEFIESEHPRAKNGQFSSKGGEGSKSKEEYSKEDKQKTLKRRAYFKEFVSGDIIGTPDGKVEIETYNDVGFTGRNGKTYKWEDVEETDKKYMEESSKESKSNLTGRSFKVKLARKPSDLKEVKNLDIDHPNDDIKISETIELNEKDYNYFVKNPLRDHDFLKGKGGYDDDGNRTGVAIRSKGKQTLVVDPSGSAYARYMGILYADEEMTNDKAIPDEQDKPNTAGEVKADKEDKKMDKEEKKESVAEVKEEKVVEDKAVDKRKLIDEIGGILKGKVDDELIRTIIGKAEQIAYNGSEAGKADDEVKAEVKKEEKKEEIVKDKCAKDECKDKMAKDEMTFDIDSIKAQVREEVMEDFKAREEARKSVKSTLGEINVMAFDSCEDIYKLACEKAGLNLDEIASYKDAFKGFSAGKALKGGLALDATPKSSGNEECFKNIRV